MKITTPYMFGGLFKVRNKDERIKGLFYVYNKNVVQLKDLKYFYFPIEKELCTSAYSMPKFREQQKILKDYFYKHWNEFEKEKIK